MMDTAMHNNSHDIRMARYLQKFVDLGKSSIAGAGGAIFVIGAAASIVSLTGLGHSKAPNWILPALIAVGALLGVLFDIFEDIHKRNR